MRKFSADDYIRMLAERMKKELEQGPKKKKKEEFAFISTVSVPNDLKEIFVSITPYP